MANINRKEVVSILKREDRWMTFEELCDQLTAEHDYLTLYNALRQMADQGRIQYTPAPEYGGDRAYWGRIGLE